MLSRSKMVGGAIFLMALVLVSTENERCENRIELRDAVTAQVVAVLGGADA